MFFNISFHIADQGRKIQGQIVQLSYENTAG